MDYSPPSDIVQLGIEAARELLGEDAVVELNVEPGLDWTDDLAYFFTYKIKKGKVFDWSPGLFRSRLIQRLLDKLDLRSDPNYPYIRSLVLTDWEAPTGA